MPSPSSDEALKRGDPAPRSDAFAYVLLAITVLIWASAFAGIRFMLRSMDPLTFTSLRLLIATIGMLVGGALAGVRLPVRGDLLRIVAAGLLGFSMYHLALNIGAKYVTAGQASFVISTIPVWTAVLAYFTLGERVTRRTWVGMGVSLAGVALLSLNPDDLSVPLGSAMVLLAALFAAGNFVVQKELLSRYEPTEMAVYAVVFGSIPLLFYLPWGWDQVEALDATGWMVMLYLGLVPITLGYWINTIALQILPANTTAQALLLIPPVAALIAWLTIGEEPGPRLYAGGALIMVGVFMGARRRRRVAVTPNQ